LNIPNTIAFYWFLDLGRSPSRTYWWKSKHPM